MNRRQLRRLYKSTCRLVAYKLNHWGVHRPEDVDDCLQEIYLDVFRCSHQIEDESKTMPWILTIARRRAAKFLEQAKKMPSVSDEIEGIEDRKGSDHTLIINERCHHVLKELEAINHEERRHALWLYLIGDNSLKEVSRLTGVSVSTLTTWCHRFREHIKHKENAEEKKLKRLIGESL